MISNEIAKSCLRSILRSIDSFPEYCLVLLFYLVVPRERGLFTASCGIVCWAYRLITML